MATDWIMVRVDRRIHAMLEAARESMRLAADVGLRELNLDDRGRVSLSQVIEELCYFRLRHAERRRKSKTKRRKDRARAEEARVAELERIAGLVGQISVVHPIGDTVVDE